MPGFEFPLAGSTHDLTDLNTISSSPWQRPKMSRSARQASQSGPGHTQSGKSNGPEQTANTM